MDSPAQRLFKMLIAQNIRKIRIRKNISQAQFSEDTKIHIARIEQGKCNPSAKTMLKISQYLDCEIYELFRGIDVHSPDLKDDDLSLGEE